MAETNNVRQSWVEMGNRLAIAFPQWVIKKLDSDNKHSAPFVIKAIPLVIIMLSVASISVINSRAEAHHAGWNSPLVSTGVAVLVPLATLAAALIKDRRWSVVFWVVSVFVAFVSGTIQFNVYADPKATGIAALEAYAFGYGIPFAEVLFAIMEAVSINQWKVQQEQAEAEAVRVEDLRRRKERDDQDAERRRKQEQETQAAKQDIERRKQEIELRAYEAKLLQDAEIEREKAMASIRIKESKSATKTATSQSQKPASQSAGVSDSHSIQMRMIPIYQREPSISDVRMANEIGKSKKTIQDLLADLVAKKVVHVEKQGRGKIVTVNGNLPAFLKGEL